MLTDFEYRYLKRNKRRFKMTRAEAADALALAHVPHLPIFIDFQTKFGGYHPQEDVTYGIVGPSDQPDGEPRFTEAGTRQLARFDLDNRLQIRHHIDENGTVYFEQTPVAESFESYIGFNAYCDLTLQSLGWTYIDHERRETKRFKAFFDRLGDAPVVPNATDQYHSVRQSPCFFEIAIGGNRRLFVCPDQLKSA